MAVKDQKTIKVPTAIRATRLERQSDSQNINIGGFKNETTILNYTDKPVYIKTQGNAPYAIQPMRDRSRSAIGMNHIEIRTCATVQTQVDMAATYDFVRKMEEGGVSLSLEARNLLEKLQKDFNDVRRIRPNTSSNSHSFYVLESEIDRVGYAYVKECGFLVSFHDAIASEQHPHSNEAWSSPDTRSYAEARHAAGNFISVVDNSHHHARYYYFSAKQIVEVEPTADPSKDPGVYFNKMVYREGRNIIETEYMNFDQAREMLGLYSTREEALSAGDPDRILRSEELRLKAENEAIRREIEAVRIRADQERLNHETELARVRFEAQVKKEKIEMNTAERKEKIDSKSTKRKEKFEKKSTKRKDKSEERSFVLKSAESFVKIAPAAVATVLMVAGGIAIGRQSGSKSSSSIGRYSGFTGDTAMSGSGSVHGAIMEAMTMTTPPIDEHKMYEDALGCKVKEIRRDRHGNIDRIFEVVDCTR